MKPEPTSVKRRPGRPPSTEARRRVLDVAREMLSTEGLGRLSIERVAERAGVGKPTIYRSWANAQELAMAALMTAPAEPNVQPRARSLRAALVDHLSAMLQSFDSARGRQVTLMMASADPDSELAKAFRNQVLQQSRITGAQLIERGIRAGELQRPPDIEVALDMIYGPIFYRLLAGQQRLKPEFIRSLVELFMQALKPQDR